MKVIYLFLLVLNECGKHSRIKVKRVCVMLYYFSADTQLDGTLHKLLRLLN